MTSEDYNYDKCVFIINDKNTWIKSSMPTLHKLILKITIPNDTSDHNIILRCLKNESVEEYAKSNVSWLYMKLIGYYVVVNKLKRTWFEDILKYITVERLFEIDSIDIYMIILQSCITHLTTDFINYYNKFIDS